MSMTGRVALRHLLFLAALHVLARADSSSAASPGLTVTHVPGGSVELRVITPATAFRTEIQQSEDLSRWSHVATIMGGDVDERIQVPVGGERLFFRAVTQERPGDLGSLWCLGDSWTDCFRGHTWRRTLSQQLDAAGWQVDFVGTLTSSDTCEEGQAFDRHHNGVAGITAEDVLNDRLCGWLESVTPDTVLLLLGGNDILAGSTIATVMTRLGSIIDALRADNPDVVIHAAVYGYTDAMVADSAVDEFATHLQSLISAKTTAQSPIHFVDHRAGWNESTHLDPGDFLHPNDAGMQKLAENWLSSLQAHPTAP